MRMHRGIGRSVHTLVILVALVATAVVVSGCAQASAAPKGAGWPNIALAAQSATTAVGTMTVTPITIGSGGARFDVSLPKGYSLARGNPAQLMVDDHAWPAVRGTAANGEQGGRRVHLDFAKGGPSIGWAKLTVFGEDGASFTFTWNLPGGGI